jgi:hypothetical protein
MWRCFAESALNTSAAFGVTAEVLSKLKEAFEQGPNEELYQSGTPQYNADTT